MESPKLKADLRNLKAIEKCGKLIFDGHRIRYNERYFIYNGAFLRFENKKVIVGDSVFIQDSSNIIYSTKDFKNFRLIGNGEIIGIIDSALIYNNDNIFYIFADGILISLFFHFKDDKLLYSHTKTNIPLTPIKNFIIFNEFLVVASENNVLFLSMNSVRDVQYRFPGIIKYFEIVENENISFLTACYCRKGIMYTAIFYHNSLLSQKVNIICENGRKYIILERFFKNTSQIHLLNESFEHCDEFLEYKPFDNFYCSNESSLINYGHNSTALLININDSYDIHSACSISSNSNLVSGYNTVFSDINIQKTSLSENYNNLAQNKFQLTEIESRAFKLSSIDQRVSFLHALFKLKVYDIISPVKKLLLHTTENITHLLYVFKSEYQEVIDSLIYNETYLNGNFNFFYKPIDKYINQKKYLNLNFNKKYTEKEKEFLNYKYHRVFNFLPEIVNSRNLAYKIIEFEEKNNISLSKNFSTSNFFQKYTTCNKFFLKLLKAHFGDTRIEEIINLILENQITLLADVDDLKNFRFDSFCVRSYLNVGAMILNCKMTYYHSIHDLPIKSNNQNTDDLMAHEFIFLNSACLASYYKKPTCNSLYSQLGRAFGIGLIKGLTDDEIQKFMKLIPGAEDEHLKFIFLVLSTRALEESHLKSLNINKILKSALSSINLELKKSAICSLAIYNSSSNDFNIINTLKNELNLRGPVVDEKNSQFYDRNYRSLVSLAIGIISSKTLIIDTSDSFASLLIAGLSSINSKTNPELFYRASDSRPDELFYSHLFILTSNFETHPETILCEFSFEKLKSNTDILISAAKIFYIGLCLIEKFRNEFDSIYDKLFNILQIVQEKLESEQKFKILFNYALCACSIAKSGTSDFNLLRILRKEILITKEIKYMSKYVYFDCKKKELCIDKKTDKESMQFYKLCIGILIMDFGMSKLSQDSVKQLIITFFYSGEISLDFNYIDILRCLIVRCLKFDCNEMMEFDKTAFGLIIKEKRKKITKYFKSKYLNLSEIDRKFVIDILSDYYENFSKKPLDEVIFDLKLLTSLISFAK